MPAASAALTQAQKDTAVSAVMFYMALKVTADCATASCWPLLLRTAYNGDVAAAATGAATMSSCCGLLELLINPMVGKLTDRFGRKAFFYLGPTANCLFSLLQIKFPTSIPVAYAQRILSQTLSTVSGSTIGTATLADVASGDTLTAALGSLGSWAGLGVIIGPLLTGSMARIFGNDSRVQIAVGFGVKAVVAGSTLLYLLTRLPETLPRDKRRPFSLSGVNPLRFLRLFRGGSTLRWLALANGFSCMCEGKMTADTTLLYIR
eukprot:SAG11_NODE_2900_length_2851_cov_1.375727_3_plen_263_part_00